MKKLRELRQRRHMRQVIRYMRDCQFVFCKTWEEIAKRKETMLYKEFFGKLDAPSRKAIQSFLSNRVLEEQQYIELSLVADEVNSNYEKQ